MAKKLTMNGQFRKSVAEVFDDFVISKTAQGVFPSGKSHPQMLSMKTIEKNTPMPLSWSIGVLC